MAQNALAHAARRIAYKHQQDISRRGDGACGDDSAMSSAGMARRIWATLAV